MRSSVDGIWWRQPGLKLLLDPHLSTFQSSSGHSTLGTWARTYSAALLGAGEMVNNLTPSGGEQIITVASHALVRVNRFTLSPWLGYKLTGQQLDFSNNVFKVALFI